jgi:rod shape-determining protein MreC
LLTYPFQAGSTHLEAGLFDGFGSLFAGRHLAAENAQLTAEVNRLTTENETLRLKAADDDRLRAAAGLAAHQSNPPLAADVIALLPTSLHDTIAVSRGTHDGVHVQTIVRTPEGLVGQVLDAGSISSEVLLLSDGTSSVGALVRRGNKMQGKGIIQGGGRGRPLKLIDLPRETDIQTGDQIVSSGDGGVFPPDVPIGTVVSVHSEDAQFLKSAVVAPAAGLPGDLREVYLLRP